MSEQEVSKEETLARYLSVPDQLDAALAGLSESDLSLARTGEAWTIRQIVHHIADAGDITTTIIKAALGGSGCVFGLEWYDPDNAWARTLNYASRAVSPTTALLRANHRDLEELLRYLPDAWGRYVMLKRHDGSAEIKVTVGQLIHSQTAHSIHHIEQIRATRRVHGV